VDPFVLSNEVLSGFVDMLEKFNPEVIRGYATPVYMMAKYLLKAGIDIVRPKSVITSAEVLFDPMRKTIEEALGCPVFDFYGCREIGAIASECQEHSGYHIAAENVVVEFARNGEPVSCEEKGSILLTGLRNYGMPLIRYENGDVGKPTTDACSCGRGLPLMESLEGRITQFLAVRDKKTEQIVPIYEPVVEFVILSLKSSPDGFRVIQESLDHIVVQISEKHVGSTDIDFLIAHLRSYLGEETKIEVQCLSRLPPLPSGKRSVLISKVNPFEQAC